MLRPLSRSEQPLAEPSFVKPGRQRPAAALTSSSVAAVDRTRRKTEDARPTKSEGVRHWLLRDASTVVVEVAVDAVVVAAFGPEKTRGDEMILHFATRDVDPFGLDLEAVAAAVVDAASSHSEDAMKKSYCSCSARASRERGQERLKQEPQQRPLQPVPVLEPVLAEDERLRDLKIRRSPWQPHSACPLVVTRGDAGIFAVAVGAVVE